MATKKSSKNTASAAAGQRRPLADSSEPEHCRIDLCTAQTEWLRTLHPDHPQPVFSTLALQHGKEAPGAARERPGFALNESMDLAWALGFPQMAFVVDGLPVPDTTDALFDLYRTKGEERHGWWQAQSEFGSIYPRRAAVARMYELDPYPADATEEEKAEIAAHVFELPEDELDSYTTYKPYSDEELANCLAFAQRQQRLAQDVLLFEALCGPDRVLRLVARSLQAGEGKAYALLSATRPLLLRARADVVEEFMRDIRHWNGADNAEAREAISEWFDVDTTVRHWLNKGKVYRQFFPFVSEDLRQTITDAALQKPSPHLPFALMSNLDQLLPALAKNLSSFETLDVDRSYLQALSSLSHPATLPALLSIGTRKEAQPQVRAWFSAHGAAFADDLRALAQSSGAIAKLAQQELDR